MAKLAGKKAVITGAGGGIGREIVRCFAAEGAEIALVDIREKAMEPVLAETLEAGAKAIAVQADIGDEASVAAAFRKIRAELGDPDIMINNAAMESSSLVEEMPVAMWDEMIRVNLRSVFLCSREVIPAMKKRKWGRIINTASNLGHKGGVELAHYCAAKAGVLGVTKAMAHELAPFGITVNSVAPGPIETPMLFSLSQEWLDNKKAELPIKRFGKPQEVAPAFVLLASDEGSYFIGASLNVNGGDIMI